MKWWLLLFAFWLPLTSWGEEAKPMANDPVVEQRMINLSQNLRCLVCQNESLASSRADLAQDLRGEIREMIRAGKSDQQIIEYLTKRYGDFVLFKPPVKPSTWLLWFGPFLLLAGTTAGLYFYLGRRDLNIARESFSNEEKARVEALLNNSENPS